LDAVLLHRGDMVGVIADSQYPAVYLGVERLDPAIHHLGKAGDLGHIGDGKTQVAKELRRAAGADKVDVEFTMQRGGELRQTGFVRDGEKSATNGDEVG